MSRTTHGYLIAIAGIAFLSTTGILIGFLTGKYGMPALQLALWRDVLVCAALFPAILLLKRSILRVGWSHLRYFVIYGFVLACFNSIWSLSVKLNGAAVGTVLAYGSTGFTALLAWRLFRERLDWPKIAAVILSLGGCVLVANAYDPAVWRADPLALSVGLLSGLFYAIYTLFGKETARRRISPWAGSLYSFAGAACFLLIFNLIPVLPGASGSVGRLLPALPGMGWLLLVTLAFIPTVFGFGLYNLALNYLPASIVNLLATLEPPMTAVMAYFLLAEMLTGIQLVGAALIIAAVLVLRLAERESSSAVSSQSPAISSQSSVKNRW